MPFPIIDISNIDDPKYQLTIAQQITDACKQWGFLLIKGHPIPPDDIQEMFAFGKEFFSLPEDEKAPWPINESQIGYIAAPPFWRNKAQKIEAFKHECHALVLKLLVCFGIAMNLPDCEFFAKAHKENTGKGNSLRMLMYPARSEKPQDVGSRMAQHTDSGSVTLLFQQAAGLEVLAPSGEWARAPCEKGCILINLGDALSFWSGNQLKATLHRVTFDGLPHDKERQSMAYFGAAHPDTVLRPLLSGVEMGEYHSNGMSLEPGITVGELNNRIMTSIYGPALKV
ncbi:Clavaminate synthase-like protein [Acephala macrosclerotiorum]|nr:Clavaminate synthase-like protein [Acephala macrosclerotiorum]